MAKSGWLDRIAFRVPYLWILLYSCALSLQTSGSFHVSFPIMNDLNVEYKKKSKDGRVRDVRDPRAQECWFLCLMPLDLVTILSPWLDDPRDAGIQQLSHLALSSLPSENDCIYIFHNFSLPSAMVPESQEWWAGHSYYSSGGFILEWRGTHKSQAVRLFSNINIPNFVLLVKSVFYWLISIHSLPLPWGISITERALLSLSYDPTPFDPSPVP